MIRTLLLAILLSASAWAETFEEMEKNTDMTNADAVFAPAKWCVDNRLPSKASQLYGKVIKLDPNHLGARAARGEVLVGDRWVNKSFAPKSGAAGGSGTSGQSPAAGKPSNGSGPAAKDVAWDLALPKDPKPEPNEFLDDLIERMRTAGNESDPMARAVATLVRDDNWPSAFPRLCAALLQPGYGDLYGPCDILMELHKSKRTREMRRLYGFIVKASEGVTDAEDLAHFAMVSTQVRERKAVPRLTELLAHASKDVRESARDSLAAIMRLPPASVTADKARAWWDANWSASEDRILLEQLRSSDLATAVEAAAALADMRNAEIFPVLFKCLRSEDPAVIKRAIEVLRGATTLDWGISVSLTPDQRIKRIEQAEKWWREEKGRFSWPGIVEPEVETPAAPSGASAPDQDLEAVGHLASTTGTEAQQAEAVLKGRGRLAVPALLDGLASLNPLIRRRAHDILRESTKQDFHYDPRADDSARAEALKAWRAWAVAEKILSDDAGDP